MLSWPTPGCGSRWPRREPPSKVLGINYIFWSLFGSFFRLLLCLEDLAFSFWMSFTCGATMRNGAFIDAFVPQGPEFWKKASIAIGPGNLYVSVPALTRDVFSPDSGVARYRASKGTLLDVFAWVDRVRDHKAIAFGPDGNLYVGAFRHPQYLGPAWDPQIWRFNGTTGAFIDSFVPIGSGGLTGAVDLAFGPDGHLYVATPGGLQRGVGKTSCATMGLQESFSVNLFLPAAEGSASRLA